MVVGIADSGVNVQLEALTSYCRGTNNDGTTFSHDYNWFEATSFGSLDEPYDIFTLVPKLIGVVAADKKNVRLALGLNYVALKSLDENFSFL